MPRITAESPLPEARGQNDDLLAAWLILRDAVEAAMKGAHAKNRGKVGRRPHAQHALGGALVSEIEAAEVRGRELFEGRDATGGCSRSYRPRCCPSARAR